MSTERDKNTPSDEPLTPEGMAAGWAAMPTSSRMMASRKAVPTA
jgi:pyrrolidone-carboxylate peptidase